MKWTNCRDCIRVDDCLEATRSDGCYGGTTEEELEDCEE